MSSTYMMHVSATIQGNSRKNVQSFTVPSVIRVDVLSQSSKSFECFKSFEVIHVMKNVEWIHTDQNVQNTVPEDFPTLGAAIDVAEDGDHILVGPGTLLRR